MKKELTILKFGQYDDVLTTVSNSYTVDHETNVPFVIGHYASRQTWGYFGDGPRAFAMNILLHFSGGDLGFARDFAVEFTRDVIEHMPKGVNCRISAKLILAWIEVRINGKRTSSDPSMHWEGVRCEMANVAGQYIKKDAKKQYEAFA